MPCMNYVDNIWKGDCSSFSILPDFIIMDSDWTVIYMHMQSTQPIQKDRAFCSVSDGFS